MKLIRPNSESQQKREPLLISHIRMERFKAFKSLALELRPITVFVGENNSGKSSILAAIRLLSQTVRSPDSSIPLLLSGELGDFGSYRDMVHGHHAATPIKLGLTLSNPRRGSKAEFGFDSEFKYDARTREVRLKTTEIRAANKHLLTVSSSRNSGVRVQSYLSRRISEGEHEGLRMFNFLPRFAPELIRRSGKEGGQPLAPKRASGVSSVDQVFSAFDAVSSTLRGVEYLAAMRRPPDRTYVNTGVRSRTIGSDGSNWPQLLALGSSSRKLDQDMTQWLSDAGIARSLEVNWLSDRHFEVVVKNPTSGETANIADVGQGTNQVVPVVVGGLSLKPGQLYIVEEPEIHLHPRAQAQLGDLFSLLHQRGVQCLLETHSEYLILRLQQLVASGRIRPSDIVFHYVEATESGKEVRSIYIDDRAVIPTTVLPEGFFPQRMSEARSLVAARSIRHAPSNKRT
jgi:predicted ATPase